MGSAYGFGVWGFLGLRCITVATLQPGTMQVSTGAKRTAGSDCCELGKTSGSVMKLGRHVHAILAGFHLLLSLTVKLPAGYCDFEQPASFCLEWLSWTSFRVTTPSKAH